MSALRVARVDPTQVRYINAHGPGTQQCDRAEADILDGATAMSSGITLKTSLGMGGQNSAVVIAPRGWAA